jgi:chromatin remodeling complex protein RSC6
MATKKKAAKKVAKKPAKKAAKKVAKKPAKKAAKKVAKKPAKKAAKKVAKKPVKKAAKKVAKKKSARKPSAAFMKPLTPSANLAAVVGAKAMPRTEVVKKIWVYIKANKLQDKANKRMINADAKLKAVFGGKSQVSMFDMAKHLAKNLS